MNTFGPIARSAADLRLLLDVLARPTPERSPAWRLDLPEPTATSLRGLRVAAWFDEPALEIDASMAAVLHGCADELEREGAKVDRSARPAIDVRAAWILGARLIGAALSVSNDPTLPNALSHSEWLSLHRERTRLRAVWAEFFRRFDVLLCPVTLVPAFHHLQSGDWRSRVVTVNGADRSYIEMEGWPALIGGVYLPSTAAPVGLTGEGLPVGMQVVAPFLHDRLAIKVAGWACNVVNGYSVPPIAR